jgi:hypothetical protein
LSSEQLRAIAAQILSERRFHRELVVDPLTSALNHVGIWIVRLAAAMPGGAGFFWAALGGLVIALAVFGSRRLLRRLAPASAAAGHARAAGTDEDPHDLERQAASAESRGAFAEAVRLRFRAGLLSLGARGAIEYRPSIRTAEVSRQLVSPQFDALAATFERAAYGNHEVGAADARASRDGWKRVLAGART